MKCIAYNDGYKYQLKEAYAVAIDITPATAIDTLSFMRGSLIHDALYQLMRESHLDHNIYREPADRVLQKICKEEGMWSVRAWWVYHGVRLFADPAADPADKRPVIRAPEGCEP
jgi:hypothetical protein